MTVMTDSESDDVRTAIACDRAFIWGLRLGYNLGLGEEREKLNAVTERLAAEIRRRRQEKAIHPEDLNNRLAAKNAEIARLLSACRRGAAAHADGFWKGRLEAAEQMRKKDEEIARLRAELDAFKVSEPLEVAMLRAALTGVRTDLALIHGCDVVHPGCKICDAVLRIDAALGPGPTSKPRPSTCQAEFSACEFPDCACPEPLGAIGGKDDEAMHRRSL
jgi:hypothetical protein